MQNFANYMIRSIFVKLFAIHSPKFVHDGDKFDVSYDIKFGYMFACVIGVLYLISSYIGPY